MPNKGMTIRSGSVYTMAKHWFNISEEDWEIMLSTMRQTYVNRYRIEFMRYKQELKRLGYSRYAIGYIVAMRNAGYTFDALDSRTFYLHFWYDGGSTHFRSWVAVKRWLNEYGRL